MMKYLINLFVIFIVSLTVYAFYGLIQSNNERIREKEIADSLAIAKQDRFNAFVKSIGTLSFYDIKLGSSFTKTVKEIQRNNNFNNIEIYHKTICDCFSADMSLLLPEEEQPTIIELYVTAYKDSIYSINIYSQNYTISKKLKELYFSKYKLEFAKNKEEEFDINKREEYIWDFNSQSISLQLNYLLSKYSYDWNPDDSRAFWGKTQIKTNLYFDDLNINYLDISIDKIVNRLEEEESKKQKQIHEQEMKEKHKRDSTDKSNKTKQVIQNI